MAIITYWRNVMRKITTQEMDASFDAVVDMIANAGLSSEMPEGTVYVGDNTNTASLETLDKTLVGLPNVDNTSDANKPISTDTQTALDLKADIASPTFTGTVTTPDIVVSDATASTIAHFDATKNIESLPLATYPSLTELSYVKGVTSAIQPQIDARSIAYAIPNYYRVDLNLGDDLTGVAGREDKPYRLIQTVWDLIPTSSTAQITIEIVGDFTFTTHALLTSVNKDNITFLFKGKIVYAVPVSPTSRPLFTFTGTNNNLTFIVPNYTQTTQGGFIYTAPVGVTNGNRYIFDNMQILMGVNTSSVNNFGFRTGTATNQAYFTCNNLTVSMTGDGSGIKGYAYPFAIASCNYKIGTLKITGTASVASTAFEGFTGTVKNIYIENLITDNSYTNLTSFSVTASITADNIFVNNINIASDGSTQKSISFRLFSISACKNLTIMSGSILNFGVLTIAQSELENLNLGELSMNGVIGNTSNPFTKNLNLLGNITKTVASQSADKFLIWIGAGAIINGNGFKIIHTDPTYIASTAIIMISGSASPKATFINNLTIYNSNIATGSTQPFVPIYYLDTNTKIVRFRNLVVSSQIDTNSNVNATFMRPYNANTSYTCRIEGNVATNYLQNVTNLTNDCDIDLINGYTL
jgi:hypothetical protein